MPLLSIVVVHFRTPELLNLCLKRLKENIGDLDYEIRVIDNSEVNLGFAKAVNKGLKETSGKYRLILNPDALITKGSIEKMLNYMENHADIGILGPKLLYFNGECQRSYRRFYRPITILAQRTFLGKFNYFKNISANFLMLDTDENKMQTPDWILGAAMMISSEAIQNVGLMDEKFFLYFEDVDWCKRFWQNGYKVVYFPDAIFYHYYPRESSKWGILDIILNNKTRWHIASAMKYLLKWRKGSVLYQ